MTLGEDLVLGLQTLALGMIVTFAGLLILQGVMILMAKFSHANGNNGRPSNATAEQASPAAVETPEAHASRPDLPDEEIAAISTVVALLAAESGVPLRVRSVRPLGPAPAAASNIWGLAGRQEIMATRRRA